MRDDEVDTSRRTPTSQLIAAALRARIESGELPVGSPVGSERELAEQWGCARNTAREAIRILDQEGRVSVRHGAPTVVADRSGRPPMDPELADELRDGAHDMEELLRADPTREQLLKSLAGWAWWLDHVAQGDY